MAAQIYKNDKHKNSQFTTNAIFPLCFCRKIFMCVRVESIWMCAAAFFYINTNALLLVLQKKLSRRRHTTFMQHSNTNTTHNRIPDSIQKHKKKAES